MLFRVFCCNWCLFVLKRWWRKLTWICQLILVWKSQQANREVDLRSAMFVRCARFITFFFGEVQEDRITIQSSGSSNFFECNPRWPSRRKTPPTRLTNEFTFNPLDAIMWMILLTFASPHRSNRTRVVLSLSLLITTIKIILANFSLVSVFTFTNPSFHLQSIIIREISRNVMSRRFSKSDLRNSKM